MNPERVAEIEALIQDPRRPLEGIVAGLKGKFSNVKSEAQDAVGAAIEKYLKVDKHIANPTAYLRKIAEREVLTILRVMRRRGIVDSLDGLMEDTGAAAEGRFGALGDEGLASEEEALRDELYADVVKHVEVWENDHVRVVALLYLEAISEGYPIDSAEVAELAGSVLGEDLSADFVRTWWSRAKKKLRAYVEAQERKT